MSDEDDLRSLYIRAIIYSTAISYLSSQVNATSDFTVAAT